MKNSAKKTHAVKSGTAEANRSAIAILEVLAGLRTPAQAAEALAISLVGYYHLETRALDAMVVACEPRPKGKQPSPEGKIAALQRELERAQRECARQQALVRVAQRSIGLKAPAPPPKSDKQGHRRRKRSPTVRALKAAEALRNNARPQGGEAVQQPLTDVGPTEKRSAKEANCNGILNDGANQDGRHDERQRT